MSDDVQADLRDRLNAAGVVPVITLHDVRKAVPLARALLAGGLAMVEIVLRTPAALDAVRAIRAEVPDCDVGIGTVMSTADLEAGTAAGASFAISPGFSPRLLQAGRDGAIPFMPAVSTPAEVLQAGEAGFETLKLFPAELLGGPQMLKMLRGPFPSARFCCTGGVTAERLSAYRAEPNVAAVGASFVAPAAAIEEGAWERITALAAGARRRWRGETEVQGLASGRARTRPRERSRAFSSPAGAGFNA